MKKLSLLLAGLMASTVLTGLVASSASATHMLIETRSIVQFANLGRARAVATGTGVALVNGSAGLGHLNTLQFTNNGDIAITTVLPVTDPIVTAGGIVEVRLTGVAAIPTKQGGIFKPISGAVQNTQNALTMATMPSTGMVRICLFYTGCNSGSLDQTLGQTINGEYVGAGIGGLITIGGSGTIRISLVGAPYTVKTVSISNRTDNGGITFLIRNGFAHGPASLTSSTALTSGVVQLVTPTRNYIQGVPGNGDVAGQITSNRIHFIPEPGLLLLLGSGAVGIALLGRKRLKK